jgi:hypothetical protein
MIHHYSPLLTWSIFFTVKFPGLPGQCLAPSYDEAGEDLADAMARLHVPEVKFNFIPKAAGR